MGHLVDRHGIRPDPAEVSAAVNFPTPVSVKEVQSFLGLCSSFLRFVNVLMQISVPLIRLLCKGNHFSWGLDEEQAFQLLKRALTSSPVLAYFSQDVPTEVQADASNCGIGAVLVKKWKGEECVVPYASRARSSRM